MKSEFSKYAAMGLMPALIIASSNAFAYVCMRDELRNRGCRVVLFHVLGGVTCYG